MTDETAGRHEAQVEEPTLTEEDFDLDNAETAESDDNDVASALERETDDGKGGAVVPKADFDSFSEDEVEHPDNEES